MNISADKNDLQKVLFVEKIGNDQFETETLWCKKEGCLFIVDNIPFIAKRVALGDTIKAEYDEEDKAYYFDDFQQISGNSTIRIYFNGVELIDSTRKNLEDFGVETEAFLNRNIVAVNVPKAIDYRPIKQYFDSGENLKQWTYEESCLCHEY
jgi:hypothetical protein